jgi:CHAD domain-containing protein
LRDGRLTDFVLRFEVWLDSGAWTNAADEALDRPIDELAGRALAKAYARAETLARRGGTLGDEAVHALRIRVKALRYTADFFAALYDRDDAERLLAATRAMQDMLGRFNDAVVGQAQLVALEDHLPGGRGTSAVIAKVRGRLAAAASCDRRELVGAWRAIERAGAFW